MTAETDRLHNRPQFTTIDPVAVGDLPSMASGSWRNDLMLDARAEVDGLTWYRVAGGFGSSGDREDWVAAVPVSSLSATGWDALRDYGGDVLATMRARVRHAAEWAHVPVDKAQAQLVNALAYQDVVQRAAAAQEGPS